jgi:hypothetical protein
LATKTLPEVVAAVQDLALAVTGVKQAPDSLPSTATTGGVACYTYPLDGVIEVNSSGFSTELHTIAIDLLVGGADYGQTYKLGLSILGPLLRKLTENPTLGGTVQTFGNITYSFNPDALLWTVKLNGVKIQHTW